MGCVITAKNTAQFHTLNDCMKKICYEIVNGGGIIRSIQNHGIRKLPHRFKTRYPDQEGVRYYAHGRFISLYYDCSPYTMKKTENVLYLDETVIRFTNLNARSNLDYINVTKEEYNPYIAKVKQLENYEKQMMQNEEKQ